MRQYYQLSSEELNDLLLNSYSIYLSLLGSVDDNNNKIKGLYDNIEDLIFDLNEKRVVLRNDYSFEENKPPVPNNIDKMLFKIKFRGM